MPADKEPKSSNKAEPEKTTADEVAKKLVIVDGGEGSVKDAPIASSVPKKITIANHEDTDAASQTAGDTPQLTDASELTYLAKAINKTTADDKDVDPEQSDSQADLASDEVSTNITVGDAIVAAGLDEAAKTEDEAVGVDLVDKSDTESALGEESASEPELSAHNDPEAVPSELEQQPFPTEIITDDNEFSDDKTATAVDDIVATESDELLKREDAEKAAVAINTKKQSKIGQLVKNWWVNPATKWGTIVGLILVVALITLLPTTRYAILNAFGVRANASLTVLSSDSQQPLKNAEVSIANQTKTTDDDGNVSFNKLKLGKQQLAVKKRGYAAQQQNKVLGWGSNPLGKVALTLTGTKFSFVAKDFLSGKNLASAEAVSGDFNAAADADGRIVLAVEQTDDKDFIVTIKAPDYRDEIVTIKPTETSEKTILMAPAKHHVFVSKRTGKYDVYKIDADGKNESVLVAATGSERDDLSLLMHPTSQYAALVSTREGKRNKDGYLLSGVFVVNVKTGEALKIGQSERIRLIDWTGDRIVYIGIVDGVSAANPGRSKLYSYEIGQPGAKELASANYFNDAAIFKGAVYYAQSSYSLPVNSAKFYKVNPDGTGASTIFDKEVWSVLRNDYDMLYLSVQQDWYELKLNSVPTKLSGAPTNLRSRVYRDNFDKSLALWTDQRDGKGVLLAYNVSTKKDDLLETRAGLTQPAAWLSNTTYVFRVSDSREVADYVKSTAGGEAQKLRDVTNTDMSYYYN